MNPINRPNWLKVSPPVSENYRSINHRLQSLKLSTVCQEARCPNIDECWTGGTATFMLMGDTCTRACKFCSVKTGNPKQWLDQEEPQKVALAIQEMKLNYVVLTSVDRDDLKDLGASHFAECIRVIKKKNPDCLIETLTPDFNAKEDLIRILLEVGPDVFAHNMETVERLNPVVRDRRASYRQSLKTLELAKKINPDQYTKTSLMLGLGENDSEIYKTLEDLRGIQCDVVTFGQYMKPTNRHFTIKKYYSPQEFKKFELIAKQMGFLYVASGPLVRSSYRAAEYFMAGVIQQKKNKALGASLAN